MANSTPLLLSDKTQAAIVEYHHQCRTLMNTQWNIREVFREIDLAYAREVDQTTEHQKAKIFNRYGDSTKFQNVTVPIVMPQVEAAVTYQAAVFLSKQPIFGWVAPPNQEDSALQFQAIVEENSIRGAWVRHLLIFFRDCFKYNLGIIEGTWESIVTAAIETDLTFTSGTQGKPKNVIWSGNVVRRWDPYNSFWDTRYKPTDVSKRGEFAGTTFLMSRVELKKFLNELPDKMVVNIKAAFESGLGTAGSSSRIDSFYIPQINPNALINEDPRHTMNWDAWAGLLDRPPGEINYKDIYEVTFLYARIIPQDFRLKVPSANTPQVWKFILVNHQVIVYAERQTNAHDLIPVLFGQANEDGLGYQTKSLATNAKPFQEIGSALVNSGIAARRRAISDRGIYNPLMISDVHINSDSPTAKIPLRPAGYGKPIADAYYPIPFRDEMSQMAFQELQVIQQFANVANGQNQTRLGQFIKGNKNNPEWEAIQANATGRDQITALCFEAQVFTPLKEIIKLNTLQYQTSKTIYSPTLQTVVKIDPIALRNAAITYKLTDGLIPTEQVIGGDAFITSLQTIGSSQQIGSAYNIGPMFSYLMKTQNVDLKPFEKSPEQIAYEQAVMAWQQLVLEGVKQGVSPDKLPPQPKPQDYGYTPNQVNPGVLQNANP